MNPLYEQMQTRQPNDFMQRFQQFQKSIKGDPQQIVQQMLNSGKITQQQLNVAIQKANQMMKFIK